MSALKSLNISTKIFGGFAITLVVIIVVAFVGFSELKSTENNFNTYRDLSIETNQSGRVQSLLLQTQINVKDFIIRANEDNAAKVQETAQSTYETIKELIALIPDTDKQQIAENLSLSMRQYITAFDEVTFRQTQIDEQVNDLINFLGPEAIDVLTRIMQKAYADGDAESAYRAGVVLRSFMLAQLNAKNFLFTNNPESFEQAKKELFKVSMTTNQMRGQIQDPETRKLAKQILNYQKAYGSSLNNVQEIILGRNDLITGTLDQIGPQIAGDINNLTASVRAQQNELGEASKAAVKTATQTTLFVSLFGVAFGVFAAWTIGRGVSNPIRAMTTAMSNLAGGNKQTIIPSTDLKNEIGDMAKAVQVFKDNMIKADELAEQQRLEEAAKLKEAERIQDLVKGFEKTITGVIDNLDKADQSMATTSEHVLENAVSTKQRSTTVSAAAEQATQNVETVSSAAEELAASITEISRQVSQANSVSHKAVDVSKHTSEEIRILEENVSKISEIVNLINDIADQTNLLALNATIEAARAGDAGKGFAVVASEVKNLANQTSIATEEIGSQIAEVQSSTSKAVQAIDGISQVISEVSEISSSISAAVEEQSSATQEIARNVEEAASGTQSVSGSIVDVLKASEEAELSANRISDASKVMSNESEHLRKEVSTFLQAVQSNHS